MRVAPPTGRTSLRGATRYTSSVLATTRVYLDHGMTGRNRNRPGLEQALAAVREGDTLVVPKLDWLARSVPDARAIGDSLAGRGIRLSLGGTVYDPNDPMGKMFFNILANRARHSSASPAAATSHIRTPHRALQSVAGDARDRPGA
jgi:DNA invertase Pin-like site-specific DNA recombinase